MLGLTTLLPRFRTNQKKMGKEAEGPHQLYFHLTYTGWSVEWYQFGGQTIQKLYVIVKLSSLVGIFIVRMFERVGGFHARQSGKYTPNLSD